MWKDIKDYEGIYQVSDDGHVRRILKDGSTKPVKNRDGKYHTVSLSKKGIKKSVLVHKLVADAFLERPTGATEINHKDGNKHNNRLENLEWVSQKENILHAIEQLKHFPYGKAPRKVRCLDKNTGEFIAEFNSISEASRVVGSANARSSIYLVCQGLQKTSHGFKWEFAD